MIGTCRRDEGTRKCVKGGRKGSERGEEEEEESSKKGRKISLQPPQECKEREGGRAREGLSVG